MAQWLAWLVGDRCVMCRRSGPSLCPDCRWQLTSAPAVEPVAPLASLGALVAYDRAGRELVTAIKYRNHRGVVAELGRAMALLVPSSVEMVSWVPTTDTRRRRRGFDQAALLAAAVGRAGSLPAPALLRRGADGPQTGRTRAQRLAGPRVTPRQRVSGAVCLVDDVVTTGSTLRAGAAALLGAGAPEVHGIALAHTPDRFCSQSGIARR